MRDFPICSIRRMVNIKYFCILVFFIFWISESFAYQNYDKNTYNPRFEIGLGGGGTRVRSRPEWSSKHYGSIIYSLSCRIAYGLSLQAGGDVALGSEPPQTEIFYGDKDIINTKDGTYKFGEWLGARYEIPMSKFNKDIHGIHTVYFSGGVTWDEFQIRSTRQAHFKTVHGWDAGEEPEEVVSSDRSYKVADVKGYYIGIAARWRLDKKETTGVDDSWMGPYGFDIGVRYTDYFESTTKYDNIVKPKSSFNNYQIYINIFLKIGLLY